MTPTRTDSCRRFPALFMFLLAALPGCSPPEKAPDLALFATGCLNAQLHLCG